MKWSRVIGQDHAKDILIAAIRSGRVAHAYCLWGPEGVGKDALAIEVARVLNCTAPIHTADSIEACGRCKSCLQMEQLEHPNVQFIVSLPAAKGAYDDDSPLLRLSDEHIALIQEQLLLKARNPYHNISIPNATQIRIASIRHLQRTLTLTAAQPGWRVVIISEADAMTIEAANAFLKTLEEPQPRVTLILTTSRRELLPATILSRCQQIHCGYLSEELIAKALIEREHVPPERARILAAMAQGSYARALELAAAHGSDDTLVQQALTFLRTALKPQRFRQELFSFVEQHLATADRNSVEILLRTVLAWLGDAFRLRHCGASSYGVVFPSGPAQQALQRFLERYPAANLAEAIAAVEHAIEAIRANAQIPLTVIAAVLRLRSAVGIGSS